MKKTFLVLLLVPFVVLAQGVPPSASGGSNTGDVTLTAVGAVPGPNGASLTGQALTLQPADGTNPGVVTSGGQTIGGAKTFSTSVKIGTAGTAVAKNILCTNTNFNFASIAANACAATTIVCTGAAAGDAVYPKWAASGIATGIIGMMWVTATDTVTVKLCNVTVSPIDPGAMDFNARVTD